MTHEERMSTTDAAATQVKMWPFIAAGLAILASGGAAWAVYGPSIFLDALRAGWTACFG